MREPPSTIGHSAAHLDCRSLAVGGRGFEPRGSQEEKKKPVPADTGSGSAGAEIDMDTPTAGSAAVSDEPPPGKSGPADVVPGPTVAPEPSALAIDTRPLTMRKGKIELHGWLPIDVISSTDLMGNKSTSTSEGFALGGSYGIDDKTEIGADYAFSLNPGDIKGPLTLHGAYHVHHDAKLDVAVAAAFVAHPIEFIQSGTTDTTTITYVAFMFGAWARYHLTDKVSLFTGLPALPSESVSLSRAGFSLPPLPYQLALGVNNGGAIALDLPVGIGIQAAPKIYAFASINLANIKISNSSNAFLFKDFIPLALGAFYSLEQIDLGLTFADDLKQGLDYLNFQLVARYYLK